MTVLNAEVFYPGMNPRHFRWYILLFPTNLHTSGNVPESLATAFVRPEQPVTHEHPSKRRKLASATRSLRQLNGLSDSRVPIGYIPLARFDLRLVCILPV